jgi:hypothetical protein
MDHEVPDEVRQEDDRHCLEPLRFAERMAQEYLQSVGKAREAYEHHEHPKALVRYEDLRTDSLGYGRCFDEAGRFLSSVTIANRRQVSTNQLAHAYQLPAE